VKFGEKQEPRSGVWFHKTQEVTACLAMPDSAPSTLAVDLHVKYIQSLDTKRNELAYHLTEHLRMNGIYWGLTALALMGHQDALDRQEMIDWVMSCWDDETGAFAPHPGHDPHIHPTLSAIQILLMQDALHLLQVNKIVAFVLALQDPETGSFCGDEWGEIDTRFTYCAVACLSLLGRLDALDVDKTVAWIGRCRTTMADSAWSKAPRAMLRRSGLA